MRQDILVSMMKKEKKRASDIEATLKQAGRGLSHLDGETPRRSVSQPSASDDSENELSNQRQFSRTRGKERSLVQTAEVGATQTLSKVCFREASRIEFSTRNVVATLEGGVSRL